MSSAAAPAKTPVKRVTKKADEAVVAAVAAPVVVAVAAPVEAKAVKATKKAAAPAASAPVAAAPVAAASAPVAGGDAVAVLPEEVRLEAEAKAITARLLAVRETVSELISEAKRMEKKAAKLQKVADKRRRRKVVEGEEGKPARISIFQIPTNISPALCAFMGRPAGSQESRSNVTKYITNYVKEHSCFDPTFKRRIVPNSVLAKLLRVSDKDEVTYLNLQSFLKVHFLKTAPKA